MAKGTDQTWAPPGLSCSGCWGQQGVGGPCSGMSKQMLLCPAGDQQPVPSCLLPAQPQGEAEPGTLFHHRAGQCQWETQSSTPGGDQTKTFMYIQKKNNPSYLNKTALSLFWALPQALLLGGFLCPAPP